MSFHRDLPRLQFSGAFDLYFLNPYSLDEKQLTIDNRSLATEAM